jgi:hypothetical protein
VAKRSKSSKSVSHGVEPDAVFVLKMLLYLVAGSFWVRLVFGDTVLPIPVGLIVGIWFSSHEKLQIDRKIEYAILLMAMYLGFWLMPGINIVR